ncbi:MAG: hypothetical protein LBP25_01820, partial [Tannerellaceae bacterium]|nr:hypothetical protein [Tannerellaceae bacterium]
REDRRRHDHRHALLPRLRRDIDHLYHHGIPLLGAHQSAPEDSRNRELELLLPAKKRKNIRYELQWIFFFSGCFLNKLSKIAVQLLCM